MAGVMLQKLSCLLVCLLNSTIVRLAFTSLIRDYVAFYYRVEAVYRSACTRNISVFTSRNVPIHCWTISRTTTEPRKADEKQWEIYGTPLDTYHSSNFPELATCLPRIRSVACFEGNFGVRFGQYA